MLEDHKRKGKVFKPPLLSLGTFIDSGWLDYSIPEFIWILLLIEDYGVHEGSRLALEFSIISNLYLTSKANNPSAPSIISFFNLLSNSDKSNLLNDMNKKFILKKIRKTFTPFIQLYPECPLSFILAKSEPTEIDSKNEYLIKYKKSLSKFFEKTGFESSIVLANVIFLVNQKCHFGFTRINI